MIQRNNLVYVALAIGLMTVAQVPAGIYLPSLVVMSHYFHIQYGSSLYITGLYLLFYGISQLIYGPISDHYGRKSVVQLGIIIFLAGSLLSCFSTTIAEMYAGASIQGLGLGSAAVVAMATLRDLFNDKRLLKVASYKSAIAIIVPLVAPIVGSYLLLFFGWRATFIFQIIYALILLVLVNRLFSETNQRKQKSRLNIYKILKNYAYILKTKNFLAFGLCRVLVISAGTASAISSSLIYQNLLHLTPTGFAWIIVFPAVGFFIGSFITKRLGKSLTVETIVKIGVLVTLLGCVSFFIANVVFTVSILGVVLPFLVFKCGTGIVFPSAITGAILPLGELAGSATALVGSVQSVGRGFFSSFVGFFYNNSVDSLAITLLTLSVIAFFISLTIKK